MRPDASDKLQKIEDCRELYLKYGGVHHEQIEREMRLMGYTDFHRRSMYRRFERGRCRSGWIERYGWNSLVRNAKCGVRKEEKSETTKQHEDARTGSNTTTPQSALRN